MAAAHAEVARPEGAGHPDGPRLRRASSTRPAAGNARRAQLRLRRCRASSPRGRSRSAPAGPASASSTSRAAASATPREVGDAMSVRVVRRARRPRARRRRRPGGARPSQRRGRAGRHRGRRRCALAESYEGGRHRFDGDVVLDRTGPFGYTVRVVPRNDLLASPAELGVVALPCA